VVSGWRPIWYSLPDSPLRARIHESLRGYAEGWGTTYLTAFEAACPMPESSGDDRGNDSPNDSPNDSERKSSCPSDQDQEEERDQHEGEEEDPAAGAPAPRLPGLPLESETPKRPKPRKPSTSNHQLLMAHYEAAFEAANGRKPLLNETVGKAAKKLLTSCNDDLERAKGYVTRCYEPGSYWRNRATLTDLARDPDKYGKGADTPARPGSGRQPPQAPTDGKSRWQGLDPDDYPGEAGNEAA
jgi:hypothetical protein